MMTLAPQQTQLMTGCGTLYWMAPELIKGDKYNESVRAPATSGMPDRLELIPHATTPSSLHHIIRIASSYCIMIMHRHHFIIP